MSASVDESSFRGEPALTLTAGTLTATFLPRLGLTGVSLRHEDGEFLALPGGVEAMREGRTTGFPLVAPWVNRLSRDTYEFGGTRADVSEAVATGRVRSDGNGLPIHGFVSGRSEWQVDDLSAAGAQAFLRASLDVDDPAFPFPHRIVVDVVVMADQLGVHTTVTPTSDRAVPLTYGWHPYLTVPGTPRERWRLRTPAWQHLLLDDHGIPTGQRRSEPESDALIGSRTFDDLYAFEVGSPARELGFAGEDGRSITLSCRDGYDHAQVWVPEGQSFASLEPMAAPTDALVTGDASVAPVRSEGRGVTAVFAVDFTGPREG